MKPLRERLKKLQKEEERQEGKGEGGTGPEARGSAKKEAAKAVG